MREYKKRQMKNEKVYLKKKVEQEKRQYFNQPTISEESQI